MALSPAAVRVPARRSLPKAGLPEAVPADRRHRDDRRMHPGVRPLPEIPAQRGIILAAQPALNCLRPSEVLLTHPHQRRHRTLTPLAIYRIHDPPTSPPPH